MQLEAKYSIGDRVFVIRRDRVELPPETCAACDGSGRVDLRGSEYHCPKCAGKKVTQAIGYGWVVCDSGTVQIVEARHRVQMPDPDDCNDDQLCTVVRYMFDSSGSGSVYMQSHLWPSRETAQAECDRRNDYERKNRRAP